MTIDTMRRAILAGAAATVETPALAAFRTWRAEADRWNDGDAGDEAYEALVAAEEAVMSLPPEDPNAAAVVAAFLLREMWALGHDPDAFPWRVVLLQAAALGRYMPAEVLASANADMERIRINAPAVRRAMAETALFYAKTEGTA